MGQGDSRLKQFMEDEIEDFKKKNSRDPSRKELIAIKQSAKTKRSEEIFQENVKYLSRLVEKAIKFDKTSYSIVDYRGYNLVVDNYQVKSEVIKNFYARGYLVDISAHRVMISETDRDYYVDILYKFIKKSKQSKGKEKDSAE